MFSYKKKQKKLKNPKTTWKHLWRVMMQTPMPAQLEHWIQIVNNRKAPYELRQNAILHLTNIRDMIDKSLKPTYNKNTKR